MKKEEKERRRNRCEEKKWKKPWSCNDGGKESRGANVKEESKRYVKAWYLMRQHNCLEVKKKKKK